MEELYYLSITDMTIVSGKIEPLKRLKEALHSRGIHRFSSIGEIQAFLNQYESEKTAIPDAVKRAVDQQIIDLAEAARKAVEARDRNCLTKFLYYIKARVLTNKHRRFVANYETIVSMRCEEAYRDLAFIKETVEGLYPTIAGAIGENLVVRELEKLSDRYYLINDFSLSFNPPVFNKQNGDRIYSIQIDHLLVCGSGIFVLETKNWSSQSVESLDLRSPVDQIKRSSFALFVFLNSGDNQGLAGHHWGSKKIPIRNVIVMTNKAPKSDFQHVKVLPIDKMNGYITYFDEVFDDVEVENIYNYLRHAAQHDT